MPPFGVNVGETADVIVGVAVNVGVGDPDVGVLVGVSVAVGGADVGVLVGVSVAVGGTDVGVLVGVSVAVGGADVGVLVGVSVAVGGTDVGVLVGVSVAVGGRPWTICVCGLRAAGTAAAEAADAMARANAQTPPRRIRLGTTTPPFVIAEPRASGATVGSGRRVVKKKSRRESGPTGDRTS